MSAEKILVVDDDPQIRRVLKVILGNERYEVIEARSGESALSYLDTFIPALVLLDVNMPGIGGLDTCHAIRGLSDLLPIIVISVRRDEADKVALLDAGADDYITKPFGKNEVLARVRAALRRTGGVSSGGPLFVSDDLEIDFERRRVRCGNKLARLTPKEFELLRYLISQRGKPVSHRELLQAVWGPDYGERVDYLRVFIKHLRKKVEPNPIEPKYILTEPWLGYRFAD
jgi:two-component system, OmpR family, KDP operon response regulator KdpE